MPANQCLAASFVPITAHEVARWTLHDDETADHSCRERVLATPRFSFRIAALLSIRRRLIQWSRLYLYSGKSPAVRPNVEHSAGRSTLSLQARRTMMHTSHLRFLRAAITVISLPALGGCYEELPAQPPQAQTPAVPAAPAAAPANAEATPGGNGAELGPNRSAGGALAGAKRSAENVVQQAEEASQRTADEAENPPPD
jgi:hypothetical protein